MTSNNKYIIALAIQIIACPLSWSQSALTEENSIPFSGKVRGILPSSNATGKYLAFMEGDDATSTRFKLLDSSGSVLLDRSEPRLREGWVRDEKEIVLVAHNEQGKGFSVKRLDSQGNEIGGVQLPPSKRDAEDFDYNAAGYGELFAVNMDTVIHIDGSTQVRPSAWKKTVAIPLYWYLLPDASIITSSGRSSSDGKEETARINIQGEVVWRYPGVLMLPNHVESRVLREPKYLISWGKDNTSFSLVKADTGELYWKVADSNDKFGITLNVLSPSERYLLLTVSRGRPNLELLLADTKEKKILAVRKVPEGTEEIQFDPAESKLFVLRKLWGRSSYRREILKGQTVPAKLRTEIWGFDLKEKATAHEVDVESKEVGGERLAVLQNDRAILIDPHSKQLRILKQRE